MKRLLLAFLFVLVSALPALAVDAPKESVYDRVLRTGTIRCGYGMWDIHLKKDPNTGKFSGIFYDYMEALGKALNLKIEWAEEVGWGDYIAGLVNDRFDAYCTVVGLNAERARQVDFLTPLFFLRSDVFARVGDARFDHHLERINQPDVTMTTIEGDLYGKIADREFPLAKKLTLPQLATTAELFTSLADGKSDVIITDASSGAVYLHNNPGKIERVKLDAPYRALPASISIKGGEYRFQRMLDIATIEMMANGTIGQILDKYDPQREAVADAADPVKVKK
jgi:ABC-type amino acid transport substrate-binding protein